MHIPTYFFRKVGSVELKGILRQTSFIMGLEYNTYQLFGLEFYYLWHAMAQQNIF